MGKNKDFRIYYNRIHHIEIDVDKFNEKWAVVIVKNKEKLEDKNDFYKKINQCSDFVEAIQRRNEDYNKGIFSIEILCDLNMKKDPAKKIEETLGDAYEINRIAINKNEYCKEGLTYSQKQFLMSLLNLFIKNTIKKITGYSDVAYDSVIGLKTLTEGVFPSLMIYADSKNGLLVNKVVTFTKIDNGENRKIKNIGEGTIRYSKTDGVFNEIPIFGINKDFGGKGEYIKSSAFKKSSIDFLEISRSIYGAASKEEKVFFTNDKVELINMVLKELNNDCLNIGLTEIEDKDFLISTFNADNPQESKLEVKNNQNEEYQRFFKRISDRTVYVSTPEECYENPMLRIKNDIMYNSDIGVLQEKYGIDIDIISNKEFFDKVTTSYEQFKNDFFIRLIKNEEDADFFNDGYIYDKKGCLVAHEVVDEANAVKINNKKIGKMESTIRKLFGVRKDCETDESYVDNENSEQIAKNKNKERAAKGKFYTKFKAVIVNMLLKEDIQNGIAKTTITKNFECVVPVLVNNKYTIKDSNDTSLVDKKLLITQINKRIEGILIEEKIINRDINDTAFKKDAENKKLNSKYALYYIKINNGKIDIINEINILKKIDKNTNTLDVFENIIDHFNNTDKRSGVLYYPIYNNHVFVVQESNLYPLPDIEISSVKATQRDEIDTNYMQGNDDFKKNMSIRAIDDYAMYRNLIGINLLHLYEDYNNKTYCYNSSVANFRKNQSLNKVISGAPYKTIKVVGEGGAEYCNLTEDEHDALLDLFRVIIEDLKQEFLYLNLARYASCPSAVRYVNEFVESKIKKIKGEVKMDFYNNNYNNNSEDGDDYEE